MSTSPAYLAGRVTGFLVRPLLPLAESALAGVLDGLFGEPDALDATYTPTPNPRSIYTEPGYDARGAFEAIVDRGFLATPEPAPIEWAEPPPLPDQVWTLERDRIDEIAGDA